MSAAPLGRHRGLLILALLLSLVAAVLVGPTSRQLLQNDPIIKQLISTVRSTASLAFFGRDSATPDGLKQVG